MTAFEQVIYNIWLATSRSHQNKPFTFRKDFKGFEETKNYIYVQRLAALFNRTPQIDPQTFFNAPYTIFPDEPYFDLKFYTTRKAIKAYDLYTKNKNYVEKS